MGDIGVSIVRTIVPVIIGWLAAVAANNNLDLNVEGLESVLIPLLTSVYYVIARALESRWPVLGWLLGLPRTPTYPSTPA